MAIGILGTVIGGALNLAGAYRTSSSQERMNERNIELQREINQANLEHSNYWNQKNYDLASEAHQAQLAQQDWANEQYIESRDYDRAMQQQIFNREDTAIQRAVDDATAAGFSPLAALGMPANSGQVVSSSSAPGSMVSNNQASVQGAGQVAPHVQAVTGLGDGLSSIGNMIATMAESMSAKEHQKQMQSADFAQRLLEMDKTHFANKVLSNMEYVYESNLESQKHLYQIAEIIQDGDIKEKLQNALLKNQADMQAADHNHQKDMLKAQQDFMSSNANNQGSGRGLHDVFNDIIDIVAQGDGRLAKWMRENKEVIGLIIEGLEIGLNMGDNLANTQSQRDVNQSQIVNNLYK